MHRLFFSTNNILYPTTLPLFSITTQHSKHYKHYHYQTQHYQLNPTALTMSAPYNLVNCSTCAKSHIDTICEDSVCFFCKKGPSIDHPVILVHGELYSKRVFGIECLVHWQNFGGSRSKWLTSTYGYTTDPRVDPKTTKHGGILRDTNKPQRQPTPAGTKLPWLARRVEDVKYKWRCQKYQREMEIRVIPWDGPCGKYITSRWGWRRCILYFWDGVAPLVMIPDKWRKDPLFPRDGYPPL
jgi:hypothetical protein